MLNIIKLYSYELKLELNSYNLREYYFQAVSNSSWANAGYIVACEIYSDKNFMDELYLLNKQFGIGIIRLDMDDFMQSEVLVEARYNNTLDLDYLNKLVKLNNDMNVLIKDINNMVKVKEVNSTKFDKTQDF